MDNYTMQNKDNYCEENFLNDIYDYLSEKLNYTLDLADICLWEWDLNTDMVAFGPYAVKLLGLTRDQATIPMSYIINNIIHKESKSDLIKALKLAKKDGILSNNSYSLAHSDGLVKWIKINGKLFRDNQNNQAFVKGIIKDITNEHLREAKLGEDLNFVETLLELIPEPLFYKNKEGKYKYFNKSFLEYLGMSYDDIYNKTVYDIAPESLAKIYDDSDKSLMSSKGTQQYETEIKYADDSIRLVDFRKTVHLNSEGEVNGILGIMYDVTKQKQETDKLHHLYMMKETFLRLNNNITLYSNRGDFFADVLINFQKLFGNSQQSSILEIDDQGIARAVASKGYVAEEISKFQIETDSGYFKGSFSYGLQEYKSKSQSLKNLIQSADKEMYTYKKTMKKNS